MKIILLMVTSINSKTTNGDEKDIYSWTSKEDRNQFFSLIKKHTAIIMGRTTFEAAEHMMQHAPGKVRVVMTKSPKKYQAKEIKDQLVFTDKSPYEIVTMLEAKGHTQALLVGGEQTTSLFLKERLINEIWVTIEPKIFGKGKNMFKPSNIEVDLKLKSVKRLNNTGTLLIKYRVF